MFHFTQAELLKLRRAQLALSDYDAFMSCDYSRDQLTALVRICHLHALLVADWISMSSEVTWIDLQRVHAQCKKTLASIDV